MNNGDAPHSEAADGEDAVDAARELTPEARRALAEADARRADAAKAAAEAAAAGRRPAPEHGGRVGPDPVRYGDWEKGGIASDF